MAAELKLIAGGGIAASLDELARQFERAGGHKIAIRYATVPDLIKLATSSDAYDAAVAPQELFHNEATRARMAAVPVATIARAGLGVAVPAGVRRPDISSEAAFKQALLAARSLATIPSSAAGAQILKVFERLGIAQEMKARLKPQAGPKELVQTMAAGEAELGMFLINVLMAPGLDVVGPVPAALDQQIVYVGRLAAAAQEPAAARAFIDFLQTPEAKKVIVAKGMVA